ncbi:MAG: hypothetical protein ACF8R7_16735, partial [Phycisphaerales bacterium JB039]
MQQLEEGGRRAVANRWIMSLVVMALATLPVAPAAGQALPPAAPPAQEQPHHSDPDDPTSGFAYPYSDAQVVAHGPVAIAVPPDGPYPTTGFPSTAHPSLCFHWPTGNAADNPSIAGWDPWWGFPMNLDLAIGASPPALSPRSINPASSSSPLISAGPGERRSLVSFAERPSIGGALDLVTGAPMLQAVDLELPFGGAVFRHVRTYADSVGLGAHENSELQSLGLGGNFYGAGGRLWDWHGLGWMMSENPIFLFDAAPWGSTVYDGSAQRFNRRCALVLDAHHSIPFDRVVIDNIPRYVAPAHFDAILDYEGGAVDSATGEWTIYPSAFTVWLQQGAVKYTIVPVYEDVRQQSDPYMSAHTRPGFEIGQPEAGVPYYGLVTRIEDRYGNYAALSYCGFRQWDCNKLDSMSGEDPDPGCIEACQNCHQKGQLERVQLFEAGAVDPTWTLIYVHRDFRQEQHGFVGPTASGGTSTDYDDYPYFRQTAVQSIYVFEGDPDLPACPTLPSASFYPHLIDPALVEWPDYGTQDYVDALLECLFVLRGVAHSTLEASNWVQHIRYTYSDDSDLFTGGPTGENLD